MLTCSMGRPCTTTLGCTEPSVVATVSEGIAPSGDGVTWLRVEKSVLGSLWPGRAMVRFSVPDRYRIMATRHNRLDARAAIALNKMVDWLGGGVGLSGLSTVTKGVTSAAAMGEDASCGVVPGIAAVAMAVDDMGLVGDRGGCAVVFGCRDVPGANDVAGTVFGINDAPGMGDVCGGNDVPGCNDVPGAVAGRDDVSGTTAGVDATDVSSPPAVVSDDVRNRNGVAAGRSVMATKGLAVVA
jgi:hypothetical protein